MSANWQKANDKRELLAQIEHEYARLVALVERFSPEERLQPLVDHLSLKDMIAHITDWESYMLRRIRAAAAGETLPLRVPDDNYDRVNAEIYAAHKDREWVDIWQDFTRVHEEALAEVRVLRESDLFDASRGEAVVGLAGEPAATFIEGNSSNHYWEHANEIEATRV
jgi:hypothetical protein